MKITQSDLQAMYPVSDHALANVEHTLSALPARKEKIIVKRKLSTAILIAAVLTLLMAGALAAAIHWDVMQFLYGKPVGSVEPLMEDIAASATDGRVTVSIGSVVHDGRALAIDWTIQSHQPDKPLHLEIERMTIGGKRVWPSTYSSLNCDWLRPGEEIRHGGDMLMLPEEFFDTYPLQVEMTVGVYEPLKPVAIEEVDNAVRKQELEGQGYFVAMPEAGTRNLIGGEKMLCWHEMTGIPKEQWDQYDRREMKLSFTLEKSNAYVLRPLPYDFERNFKDFTLEAKEVVMSPLGFYVTVRLYPEENSRDAAFMLSNRNAFVLETKDRQRLPFIPVREKKFLPVSGVWKAGEDEGKNQWYNQLSLCYVGYDAEQLPDQILLVHQCLTEQGYVDAETPMPIDLTAK